MARGRTGRHENGARGGPRPAQSLAAGGRTAAAGHAPCRPERRLPEQPVRGRDLVLIYFASDARLRRFRPADRRLEDSARNDNGRWPFRARPAGRPMRSRHARRAAPQADPAPRRPFSAKCGGLPPLFLASRPAGRGLATTGAPGAMLRSAAVRGGAPPCGGQARPRPTGNAAKPARGALLAGGSVTTPGVFRASSRSSARSARGTPGSVGGRPRCRERRARRAAVRRAWRRMATLPLSFRADSSERGIFARLALHTARRRRGPGRRPAAALGTTGAGSSPAGAGLKTPPYSYAG